MNKTIQKPAVRALLALLCCALWGSAFPCVKIGYEWLQIETTGSQILFAGYRFFLAGVLTLAIGCVMEKRILIMKKSSVLYVVRQGLLQTTLQYLFFYIGMANTTGTKGSVINASNAFVSIVAAPFFFKNEKVTWKQSMGCVLGILGVVLVNLEPGAWGSGFTIKGEGMVFLCTIVAGLATVLLKTISHMESAMTITGYHLSIGGAVLVAIGLVSGGHIGNFDAKSVILLVYMALISTVAFSVWTLLLKYNPVGKVAIFNFSIPIFGVALSAMFLGEQIFSLKNAVALLCVSAGIIVVNKWAE